jgi:predicted nucleotidyltransferase
VPVLPGDVSEGLRRALAGRDDVRLGLLFGSRARGRARSDSDVDLAVLAPGVDLLDLTASLTLALDLEVQVIDLDDASIPLLQAIVRDGVLVHEGKRGAAAIWRSHALATLETDGPWYARMSEAWLRRVAERGVADG